MKIQDTLSGTKREFTPLEDEVRMYVCGITPYSESHVGHAMFAIVFDIVRRYLEYRGHRVRHVQNFTDVEDKLIERANAEGVEVATLAERHIEAYMRHLSALNVKQAHVYPRATQEIPSMIKVIEGIIERDAAYAAEGDVYFRVTRDPLYGKLSHRSVDSMRAGVRAETELKEHPLDFALWKRAKPGEPSWDSPWGPGRPGWHIECSAMALHYLGETLDIHGGGQDLIFPHHENEIAQSEAYNDGLPLAQFWMHNGMMLFEDEKMSKSLGNLVTITEALENHSPDALRYLVLSSHYRSPATYSEELMVSSERAVGRLRQALNAGDGSVGQALDPDSYRVRFLDAMEDDFGTPQAMAALFDLAREINRAADDGRPIVDAQHSLGVLGGDVLGFTFAEREARVPPELAARIQDLVDRRTALRSEKNFAEADAVRDELAALNVTLTDSARGTLWRVETG